MLTGTPVRNNLDVFFTLFPCVSLGLLGTKVHFKNNFEKVLVKGKSVNPVRRSGNENRSFILHKMVESEILQMFNRKLILSISFLFKKCLVF